MESLILAAYLFMATFIFLSWLVTPVKSNKIEANDEKSTVTEEVISIENSMTEEKLNSLKHVESLKHQLKSKPKNEDINIEKRSINSLINLDNQKKRNRYCQVKNLQITWK